MVSESQNSGRRRGNERRPRPRRRQGRDDAPEGPELIERAVKIRRVSKVVKGGRNLTFSAMMVVGDGNGRVGAALGKAASVPDAVRKGRQNAERVMRPITRRDSTIPHEVVAKFGSAKVLLLPASPGTGVIAGGGVRAVIEAAGIEDVLSKTYGGNNPVNSVRATLKALEMLRDPRRERARRLGLGYVSNGNDNVSTTGSETESVASETAAAVEVEPAAPETEESAPEPTPEEPEQSS